MFIQMSMVALYSLFPLFNGIQEKFTKILIFLVYLTCAYEILHTYYNKTFNTFSNIAVACIISCSIIMTEVFSFMYENRYPFLPLLLTSLICAILLLKLWIQYSIMLLEDINTKNNNNIKNQ